MATNNPTLIDVAKAMDPNGSIADVANMLSQTNQILLDATSIEGNLPTGHQVSIATGLPAIYYRALNQGVATSKAVRAQVTEGFAIVEARSEIDIDIANINGNTNAFRLAEARLFIEGMNQTMASGIFYGNPATDPKQFLGLAPRYSSTAAGNGQNILLGGSIAPNVNTSVWLAVWGPECVYTIYPKGSKAGLLQEDLGRATSQNAGGADLRMEVLSERFQWKMGVVVKDWRYAVRIANIEAQSGGTNSITGIAGSMAPTLFTNLLHLMARAIARIPYSGMGRMAFYLNRTVFSGLMRLGLEKSSAAVTVIPALDQFGTPQSMLSFLGVPIRQCDAILNTEALVS